MSRDFTHTPTKCEKGHLQHAEVQKHLGGVGSAAYLVAAEVLDLLRGHFPVFFFQKAGEAQVPLRHQKACHVHRRGHNGGVRRHLSLELRRARTPGRVSVRKKSQRG